MKLSIVIPCYEMMGEGENFLKHSLEIIKRQSFKDFEVIVSDNSDDDAIKNLCKKYSFVRWFRSKKYGISANTNYGMKKAKGELIKFLFQDDFLYDEDSLMKTVNAFKGEWLVSACECSNDGVTFYRPFYPHYSDDIWKGNNTISSPSVLTIRNKSPLLFDERLTMLMDCDYYKRLYDKFGLPTILSEISVVNRTWGYQTSTTLSKDVTRLETSMLEKKYDYH